ncbi:hypothetical protein VU06_02400, partial [Desulfobulbus sp. F3]|nr:hypothetical protein [Desulfobulbus sp. F3]
PFSRGRNGKERMENQPGRLPQPLRLAENLRQLNIFSDQDTSFMKKRVLRLKRKDGMEYNSPNCQQIFAARPQRAVCCAQLSEFGGYHEKNICCGSGSFHTPAFILPGQ